MLSKAPPMEQQPPADGGGGNDNFERSVAMGSTLMLEALGEGGGHEVLTGLMQEPDPAPAVARFFLQMIQNLTNDIEQEAQGFDHTVWFADDGVMDTVEDIIEDIGSKVGLAPDAVDGLMEDVIERVAQSIAEMADQEAASGVPLEQQAMMTEQQPQQQAPMGGLARPGGMA